jgi:hypothetical protein
MHSLKSGALESLLSTPYLFRATLDSVRSLPQRFEGPKKNSSSLEEIELLRFPSSH